MNLVRTIDADPEPLTLTEVKGHLRITDSDGDSPIRQFMAAIRRRTETFLRKSLMTTTWQYKADSFEQEMMLPMEPIASITSVQYVDTDGVTQTLDSSGYQFDRKGRIKPSYDNDWPSTREQYDAVTITYVAGWDDREDVPQDIKLAMKLWIGACDLNRENIAFTQIRTIPDSAKDLLSPYRNWRV